MARTAYVFPSHSQLTIELCSPLFSGERRSRQRGWRNMRLNNRLIASFNVAVCRGGTLLKEKLEHTSGCVTDAFRYLRLLYSASSSRPPSVVPLSAWLSAFGSRLVAPPQGTASSASTYSPIARSSQNQSALGTNQSEHTHHTTASQCPYP